MKPALAAHRLRAQRLVGALPGDPATIVGHLGAVQSQLPDMALWAIGRRCDASMAEVSRAFANGDFVRTHVLRPTWHDVRRSDLRDLLDITAPRIRRLMASGNARDGLSRADVEFWAGLAVEAIRTDGPLTRPEVEARLTDAGFVRQGNGMAHVMMEAELTGQVANGPIRGKAHTYAALDLPPSTRSPDEQLAWLAQTYGRGHGPFRDRDLAWWASLTLTQARQAIRLAELRPLELAGDTYVTDGDLDDVSVPRALLLPNFDEFISYARDPEDFDGTGGRDWGMLMRAAGLFFVDGRLAGSWGRTIRASSVAITVTPARPVNRATQRAIEAEAARFADFLALPGILRVH